MHTIHTYMQLLRSYTWSGLERELVHTWLQLKCCIHMHAYNTHIYAAVTLIHMEWARTRIGTYMTTIKMLHTYTRIQYTHICSCYAHTLEWAQTRIGTYMTTIKMLHTYTRIQYTHLCSCYAHTHGVGSNENWYIHDYN